MESCACIKGVRGNNFVFIVLLPDRTTVDAVGALPRSSRSCGDWLLWAHHLHPLPLLELPLADCSCFTLEASHGQ